MTATTPNRQHPTWISVGTAPLMMCPQQPERDCARMLMPQSPAAALLTGRPADYRADAPSCGGLRRPSGLGQAAAAAAVPATTRHHLFAESGIHYCCCHCLTTGLPQDDPLVSDSDYEKDHQLCVLSRRSMEHTVFANQCDKQPDDLPGSELWLSKGGCPPSAQLVLIMHC